MNQLIQEVDPGELRLPPSRAAGADPWKLHQQMRQFGASREGMPPIFVYEVRTDSLKSSMASHALSASPGWRRKKWFRLS